MSLDSPSIHGTIARSCHSACTREWRQVRPWVGLSRYWGREIQGWTYRLPRYIRRKLSRLVRKWFVYISVAGVMGGSHRYLDHINVSKLWQLAKRVFAYVMIQLN